MLDKPIWLPSEVADYLRCTVTWVYAQIRAEKLACIRLGRGIRIKREEVLRFVGENEGKEE